MAERRTHNEKFNQQVAELGKLGLDLSDPGIQKLMLITGSFAGLKMPPERTHLGNDFDDSPYSGVLDSSQQYLRYGIDYFFGKYHGRPRSVKENAAAAIYQERQGVEAWRIMKSIAFTTPQGDLLIAHLRGDRNVNVDELSRSVGIKPGELASANLESFGLAYGIVNPFITPHLRIQHIFDRDLVSGSDHPGDDILIASSGDSRIFVGFNVRHYLAAVSQMPAEFATIPISEPETEAKRIAARRSIRIIGGDSSIDTMDLGRALAAEIIRRLKEHGQFYGDRSLPDITILSDPTLAGSIDTATYALHLVNRVKTIANGINRLPNGQFPIVTFSSTALSGIGAKVLRGKEGLEYVGPLEATAVTLQELEMEGVEISQTLLLGLPSTYDQNLSAYSGSILDKSIPLSGDLQTQITKFIQTCKTGQMDDVKFYQIIEKALRKATREFHGPITSLQGKNVAVILGASELESFIRAKQNPPHIFSIIKSNETASIADQVKKAPDTRIRLVFMEPNRDLIRTIAQKAIVPSSSS